jgi:hypothetical protein
MKKVIVLIVLFFHFHIVECDAQKPPNTIFFGFNRFNNNTNVFVCGEVGNKNIIGIGLSSIVTGYYIRNIKLAKSVNMTCGVPIVYNNIHTRHDCLDDGKSCKYFLDISPFIGVQFLLGHNEWLKFRFAYSPYDYNLKKDINSKILNESEMHKLGFGVMFKIK